MISICSLTFLSSGIIEKTGYIKDPGDGENNATMGEKMVAVISNF
jgi:hypothetical protein